MLNIKKTLSAFHKLKILIVGDVMLDSYLTGKVDRISPEAPVPIVNISHKEDRPGGAANVAFNIKSLGATPFLCSVVGNDAAGEKLVALLPSHDISTKYLISSDYRRTTVKTRIIAQNQQMLRFDEEDTQDLLPKESKELISAIKLLLEKSEIDAIIFQDYNKGVLSNFVIREIFLLAIRNDVPTIIDPKNKNFFAYKRATLFKPNLKEINDNLPFESKPNFLDIKKAADHIEHELHNNMTLITLSDKGIFYSHKEEQDIVPTKPRNIADVCGAGDSVISVAACCVALGLPLRDIAELANLAGGQVCEKVGVVPVCAKELEEDYLKLVVE